MEHLDREHASLQEFLVWSSRIMKASINGRLGKVNMVVGNEACDLDSAVCSLVYAYHLWKKSGGGSENPLVIPVLNIPEADYSLRTEVKFALNEQDIHRAHLIFADHVDPVRLQSEGNLQLTLVDHHLPVGKFAGLVGAVIEVVDHHAVMSGKNVDFLKNIHTALELVGSCSTLVGEKLLGDPLTKSVSPVTAYLLYETIIVDTVNFSPQAGKATAKDRHVADELQKMLLSAPTRDQIFQRIVEAKSDVSRLSIDELVRKDLKVLEVQHIRLAVASVPCLVRDCFVTERQQADLESSCLSNFYTGAVVLGISMADKSVQRDMLVFVPEASDLDKHIGSHLLKEFCSSTEPNLQLCVDADFTVRDDRYHYFRQGNVTASRKQILPMLQRLLEKQLGNLQGTGLTPSPPEHHSSNLTDRIRSDEPTESFVSDPVSPNTPSKAAKRLGLTPSPVPSEGLTGSDNSDGGFQDGFDGYFARAQKENVENTMLTLEEALALPKETRHQPGTLPLSSRSQGDVSRHRVATPSPSPTGSEELLHTVRSDTPDILKIHGISRSEEPSGADTVDGLSSPTSISTMPQMPTGQPSTTVTPLPWTATTMQPSENDQNAPGQLRNESLKENGKASGTIDNGVADRNGEAERARFNVGDSLDQPEAGNADLVLTNARSENKSGAANLQEKTRVFAAITGAIRFQNHTKTNHPVQTEAPPTARDEVPHPHVCHDEESARRKISKESLLRDRNIPTSSANENFAFPHNDSLEGYILRKKFGLETMRPTTPLPGESSPYVPVLSPTEEHLVPSPIMRKRGLDEVDGGPNTDDMQCVPSKKSAKIDQGLAEVGLPQKPGRTESSDPVREDTNEIKSTSLNMASFDVLRIEKPVVFAGQNRAAQLGEIVDVEDSGRKPDDRDPAKPVSDNEAKLEGDAQLNKTSENSDSLESTAKITDQMRTDLSSKKGSDEVDGGPNTHYDQNSQSQVDASSSQKGKEEHSSDLVRPDQNNIQSPLSNMTSFTLTVTEQSVAFAKENGSVVFDKIFDVAGSDNNPRGSEFPKRDSDPSKRDPIPNAMEIEEDASTEDTLGDSSPLKLSAGAAKNVMSTPSKGKGQDEVDGGPKASIEHSTTSGESPQSAQNEESARSVTGTAAEPVPQEKPQLDSLPPNVFSVSAASAKVTICFMDDQPESSSMEHPKDPSDPDFLSISTRNANTNDVGESDTAPSTSAAEPARNGNVGKVWGVSAPSVVSSRPLDSEKVEEKPAKDLTAKSESYRDADNGVAIKKHGEDVVDGDPVIRPNKQSESNSKPDFHAPPPSLLLAAASDQSSASGVNNMESNFEVYAGLSPTQTPSTPAPGALKFEFHGAESNKTENGSPPDPWLDKTYLESNTGENPSQNATGKFAGTEATNVEPESNGSTPASSHSSPTRPVGLEPNNFDRLQPASLVAQSTLKANDSGQRHAGQLLVTETITVVSGSAAKEEAKKFDFYEYLNTRSPDKNGTDQIDGIFSSPVSQASEYFTPLQEEYMDEAMQTEPVEDSDHTESPAAFQYLEPHSQNTTETCDAGGPILQSSEYCSAMEARFRDVGLQMELIYALDYKPLLMLEYHCTSGTDEVDTGGSPQVTVTEVANPDQSQDGKDLPTKAVPDNQSDAAGELDGLHQEIESNVQEQPDKAYPDQSSEGTAEAIMFTNEHQSNVNAKAGNAQDETKIEDGSGDNTGFNSLVSDVAALPINEMASITNHDYQELPTKLVTREPLLGVNQMSAEEQRRELFQFSRARQQKDPGATGYDVLDGDATESTVVSNKRSAADQEDGEENSKENQAQAKKTRFTERLGQDDGKTANPECRQRTKDDRPDALRRLLAENNISSSSFDSSVAASSSDSDADTQHDSEMDNEYPSNMKHPSKERLVASDSAPVTTSQRRVSGERDEIWAVDLTVIEPYKKVLKVTEVRGANTALYVACFFAVFLPPRSMPGYENVMQNIFRYFMSGLDLLDDKPYKLIFFNGAIAKGHHPRTGWLHQCYRMIDRRMQRNLLEMIIVHPNFWFKTQLQTVGRAMLGSAFYRKIRYVDSLDELQDVLPGKNDWQLDQLGIPTEIMDFDRRRPKARRPSLSWLRTNSLDSATAT